MNRSFGKYLFTEISKKFFKYALYVDHCQADLDIHINKHTNKSKQTVN